MNGMSSQARYHVFLLRLWSDSAQCGGRDGVRCSLENPMTRNRRGFESVEALAYYLGNLAGEPERPAGDGAIDAPSPQGPAREEVKP